MPDSNSFLDYRFILLMGLCVQILPSPAAGQMDTDSGGRAAPSTTVLDGRWDTEENELSQRGGAITSAQADAVDLQPGIRAGLNFATFGGDEAETIQTLLRGLPSISGIEEGRRTGLIAGVFVVADFGGPVALRPGIRYIQKGSQIEFTVQNFGGETESGSITIKADYLEVPIQARVELPAVGPVVPHVLAGPTVGFSVNTAAEVSLGEELEAMNVGEDLGGNGISLEFGAGAGIEVGAGRMVTLDARFGLGLSDVPGLRFSAQNRGIMATVGLTF